MGILGIYVRTSVDTDGTSIDQQKKEGIKFCKKYKFEYQIYEDEGKSGFKIEGNENPFKNRKGLTNLIQDIEKNLIDKVWVWEHSRFSRNQYGSYVLFRIFEKYGIIVYEKDKQFDMNDPQSQMIRGVLDSISQYERHLIVGRTTRGLHNSINKGIRGYREFYGYKKDGKTDDGYVKWVPVKSEIENIKYCYQKLLEGSTVKSIVIELYKNKKINENTRSVLTKKWTRVIRHFENTGYSLNTDGLKIFNSFKRCEIESLRELDNTKYYVKSITYPRIQPTSATPPHSAKTSAGVLKPKHFIGVALILLTTVSIFFCVVKLQLCFLGKYLRSIPFRFSMLPFSQLW
jgi:DNA invertase Pin-like site-specific DNA recombinase